MKKALLMAAALLLFIGCNKEKEPDPLVNTTWKSGQYDENTSEAVVHGVVYYNDGDACRELWEFTDYGCVWRYLTYQGEKISFIGLPDYELNGSELVIVGDTTRTYKYENNKIVSYYNDGRQDAVFYKIK